MRRISLYRYRGKLRGVKRRLRALDAWAESFNGFTPSYDGRKFLNYKIPVLDRLVEHPTTKLNIQTKAFASLIKAARHLAENKDSCNAPYYRVAVLLVLPNMFNSEVTLFFDRDYYKGFNHTQNLLPDHKRPSALFNVSVPDDFTEIGCLVEWEDEYDEDEVFKVSQEWWTVGQPM